MWRRLLSFLGFLSKPAELEQHELDASLRLHKRRQAHKPDVDSAAETAVTMTAYKLPPGKYVGLGAEVIKERRRLPRIRNY